MYEFLGHPFRAESSQIAVFIIFLLLTTGGFYSPAVSQSHSFSSYLAELDVGLGTLQGRGRLAILRRQIWVRAEPMIVHTYTAGKSIQSPVENLGTYVLKVTHTMLIWLT